MPKIYDVSLPIVSGGVTYPDNPAIEIELVSSMAKGASANNSRISFGSHTATHIDAQRHFVADGSAVDDIPLDLMIGPARLIRFPDDVMAITADHLKAEKIAGETRVLFATRNSGFNRGPTFIPDFTYVAPDAAEYLVAQGIKLVGVDYLSVEQFRSGHHRTHKTLLGAGVVIVEGLDLSEPPAGSYELLCLPLRLKGLDGAPARVALRSMQ